MGDPKEFDRRATEEKEKATEGRLHVLRLSASDDYRALRRQMFCHLIAARSVIGRGVVEEDVTQAWQTAQTLAARVMNSERDEAAERRQVEGELPLR